MIRSSRKLKKDEVILRMKNRAKVAALAVGSCSLSLPTGLVMELNNCYYVPNITKNIISVSCLVNDGYTFEIRNKGILIFKNEMFFGSAEMFNGIYVLNLQCPILNIETKKLKSNNSKNLFLWHYHLGHINETRLTKLYKDGYLGSFD